MMSAAPGFQNDGAGQLWCAVANTEHGKIPGKAKDGTCWYPYGGKEHVTKDFQIIHVSGTSPEPQGPPHGRHNDGCVDYWCAVADTRHGKIPGKAQGGTCWYPYGGGEHLTANFKYVVTFYIQADLEAHEPEQEAECIPCADDNVCLMKAGAVICFVTMCVLTIFPASVFSMVYSSLYNHLPRVFSLCGCDFTGPQTVETVVNVPGKLEPEVHLSQQSEVCGGIDMDMAGFMVTQVVTRIWCGRSPPYRPLYVNGIDRCGTVFSEQERDFMRHPVPILIAIASFASGVAVMALLGSGCYGPFRFEALSNRVHNAKATAGAGGSFARALLSAHVTVPACVFAALGVGSAGCGVCPGSGWRCIAPRGGNCLMLSVVMIVLVVLVLCVATRLSGVCAPWEDEEEEEEPEIYAMSSCSDVRRLLRARRWAVAAVSGAISTAVLVVGFGATYHPSLVISWCMLYGLFCINLFFTFCMVYLPQVKYTVNEMAKHSCIEICSCCLCGGAQCAYGLTILTALPFGLLAFVALDAGPVCMTTRCQTQMPQLLFGCACWGIGWGLWALWMGGAPGPEPEAESGGSDSAEAEPMLEAPRPAAMTEGGWR